MVFFGAVCLLLAVGLGAWIYIVSGYLDGILKDVLTSFLFVLSIFDTFEGKSHVYGYGFEFVHYAFAGVRTFEV